MEIRGNFAAHHLFKFKVTAVCLQITTCFSAGDFAHYVEYKFHFLALSISAVDHDQVQILIVRKIFLNIPAQKCFGPVQTKITRHITRYVSTDYAVLFGLCKANPGYLIFLTHIF
jgi:hypothetical protein